MSNVKYIKIEISGVAYYVREDESSMELKLKELFSAATTIVNTKTNTILKSRQDLETIFDKALEV